MDPSGLRDSLGQVLRGELAGLMVEDGISNADEGFSWVLKAESNWQETSHFRVSSMT